MTQKTVRPGFKILGIHSLTAGVLNRPFFEKLWEMLGSEPLLDSVLMPLDDILYLDPSSGPLSTMLTIPEVKSGEMNGCISLWIDDFEAATQWLSAKGVGFVCNNQHHKGLVIDPAQFGEKDLCIRLSQADESLKARYLSASLPK